MQCEDAFQDLWKSCISFGGGLKVSNLVSWTENVVKSKFKLSDQMERKTKQK